MIRATLLAATVAVASAQALARTSLDPHRTAPTRSMPAVGDLAALPGGSFRGEIRSFAASSAAGRGLEPAGVAGRDEPAAGRDDVAPDSFEALSEVDRWSAPDAEDDPRGEPLTASAFVLACLAMLVFMQRRLRRR